MTSVKGTKSNTPNQPEPEAWKVLTPTQKQVLYQVAKRASRNSAAAKKHLIRRCKKLGFSEQQVAGLLDYMARKAQLHISF